MEKSSVKLLESLAVTTITDVRAHVGSLSGGQRQAVAIARVAARRAERRAARRADGGARRRPDAGRCSTSSARCASAGSGVVVISHNLADVFDVADRIIVLRLGRRVATFDVKGASAEDVVGAITGAEFGPAPDETGGQP